MPEGRGKPGGVDELRRGGHDDRRGDQDPGEEGEEDAGEEEALSAPWQAGGRRRLWRRLFPGGEQVFHQGEQVVHGPVQHQGGGGIIQEHQEDGGGAPEGELLLQGAALCIHGAGDEVDDGHEDGQEVHLLPEKGQQPVRGPQVRDGAEGSSLKGLVIGEKIVGGDEEGYLQGQGKEALQHIPGLIVVFRIPGAEHHEALVALEGFLEMVHHRGQPALGFPLLRLDGVGPAVQGEQEQVHAQAQHEDGETVMVQKAVGQAENVLKKNLERGNEKLIQQHGAHLRRGL